MCVWFGCGGSCICVQLELCTSHSPYTCPYNDQCQCKRADSSSPVLAWSAVCSVGALGVQLAASLVASVAGGVPVAIERGVQGVLVARCENHLLWASSNQPFVIWVRQTTKSSLCVDGTLLAGSGSHIGEHRKPPAAEKGYRSDSSGIVTPSSAAPCHVHSRLHYWQRCDQIRR
jgi:hypothetical protein